MQFRPAPPPQVRDVRPAHRPPRIDRDCPLHTAGDRCLWHAGGTAGENDEARTWRGRLPARPEVGTVRGDDCLVGEPRRRRGRRLPLGCEQPSSRLIGVPLGSAFVALDSQDAGTGVRPVSPVLVVIDHPGHGFGHMLHAAGPGRLASSCGPPSRPSTGQRSRARLGTPAPPAPTTAARDCGRRHSGCRRTPPARADAARPVVTSKWWSNGLRGAQGPGVLSLCPVGEVGPGGMGW